MSLKKIGLGILSLALALTATLSADSASARPGGRDDRRDDRRSRPGRDQLDRAEARKLVKLTYNAVLFRDPDTESGRDAVELLMREGSSALSDLAYEMGYSQEFRSNIAPRYSARQIVDNLYQVLLSRRGESEGVQFWVRHIRDGKYGDVMRGFVDSEEFRRLHRL